MQYNLNFIRNLVLNWTFLERTSYLQNFLSILIPNFFSKCYFTIPINFIISEKILKFIFFKFKIMSYLIFFIQKMTIFHPFLLMQFCLFFIISFESEIFKNGVLHLITFSFIKFYHFLHNFLSSLIPDFFSKW